MATVALIHGGGDSGWAWHRVADELRRRGHAVVAPDLPNEHDDADLSAYAATVGEALDAIGARPPLVVAGHSLGAFSAPIVAQQQGAARLVLLAPMIPLPGETVSRWWTASGYAEAAREQAEADGGLTNHPDPMISFYNGVPRDLAEEAVRRGGKQSAGAVDEPLPLGAWPDVETRVVLFTDDRFLPVAFGRRLARERLGVAAEELPGGHCAPLSHPVDVAEALVRDLG